MEDDILQGFEDALINALKDLAERANKVDDYLNMMIGNKLIDDIIDVDGYYIEFDSLELPIRYPIRGEKGVQQWKEIAESAPKLFYDKPSETKPNDTCYYINDANGRPLWFYLEDCVESLRLVCDNVDTELVFCRRFTFHAQLNVAKYMDDWIK
jgi:hypothetical protein